MAEVRQQVWFWGAFGGWVGGGAAGTLKYKCEKINIENPGETREADCGEMIVSVQWKS